MNENLLTPRVARRWQDVLVSYFTCYCCGGEWSLERFPDSLAVRRYEAVGGLCFQIHSQDL